MGSTLCWCCSACSADELPPHRPALLLLTLPHNILLPSACPPPDRSCWSCSAWPPMSSTSSSCWCCASPGATARAARPTVSACACDCDCLCVFARRPAVCCAAWHCSPSWTQRSAPLQTHSRLGCHATLFRPPLPPRRSLQSARQPSSSLDRTPIPPAFRSLQAPCSQVRLAGLGWEAGPPVGRCFGLSRLGARISWTATLWGPADRSAVSYTPLPSR